MSPRSRRLNVRSLLLIALGSALATGCGGKGHRYHEAKGQIRFTVTWPTSAGSRVIPTSAQSLVVKIKQGSTLLTSQTIVRPTTTATFSELPIGTLSVVVEAYATVDGTGTMLASATAPATISDGTTTSIDVTLASLIDHLEISPSPLTLGALQSGAITVTAKDAGGSIVLVSPSSLSFSSSNASVISVDSTGLVTAGGSIGSATVTVSEADSGKTANLSVTVVPTVTLTPVARTLVVRGAGAFVATVVGVADTSVTWSVQEGAPGGTITSGGVYTAPSVRGTYHVVATSNADAARKAIATVTVQSGSLSIGVH